MMFYHYLLVVLVVLLGNFQRSLAENESFKTPQEALSEASLPEPDQVNTSRVIIEGSVHNKEALLRSHDGLVTAKAMKVTDLHDPFNIIDKINNTDKIHSHSITPEDFAQVTSLSNITFKGDSPSEPVVPNLGESEDKELTLLIVPVQDLPLDEYKLLPDPSGNSLTQNFDQIEENLSGNGVQNNILDSNHLVSSVEEVTEKSSHKSELNGTDLLYLEDHIEVTSAPSNDPNESLKFSDFAKKVKDELKTYSNEAVIEWEDLKERVSADNEVSHVLNDYHDKITISQAVNRSECALVHVQNYDRRMEIFKGVMQSCESSLKREQWQTLQNRTKTVLNAIQEVVQATNLATENLKTNADENLESIEKIESEGKRKLELLSIESEKQDLLNLKISALSTDEEAYRDCITRNTAHDIVVDTLNDIMKIKNHCVG